MKLRENKMSKGGLNDPPKTTRPKGNPPAQGVRTNMKAIVKFDEGKRASLKDSLNLLWDIINSIDNNDIERAKTRIKEYGYIAYPEHIMKLLEYIENYKGE